MRNGSAVESHLVSFVTHSLSLNFFLPKVAVSKNKNLPTTVVAFPFLFPIVCFFLGFLFISQWNFTAFLVDACKILQVLIFIPVSVSCFPNPSSLSSFSPPLLHFFSFPKTQAVLIIFNSEIPQFFPMFSIFSPPSSIPWLDFILFPFIYSTAKLSQSSININLTSLECGPTPKRRFKNL